MFWIVSKRPKNAFTSSSIRKKEYYLQYSCLSCSKCKKLEFLHCTNTSAGKCVFNKFVNPILGKLQMIHWKWKSKDEKEMRFQKSQIIKKLLVTYRWNVEIWLISMLPIIIYYRRNLIEFVNFQFYHFSNFNAVNLRGNWIGIFCSVLMMHKFHVLWDSFFESWVHNTGGKWCTDSFPPSLANVTTFFLSNICASQLAFTTHICTLYQS